MSTSATGNLTGSANLTYHVRTGQLTGTLGGKSISSSVLLAGGGARGTNGGQYLISPPHTDSRLGLCAVVTLLKPNAVTIDNSPSPARNAVAGFTITFTQSKASNMLAFKPPLNAVTITSPAVAAANALAGQASTIVINGSKELMEALAAAGGGTLEIVA